MAKKVFVVQKHKREPNWYSATQEHENFCLNVLLEDEVTSEWVSAARMPKQKAFSKSSTSQSPS